MVIQGLQQGCTASDSLFKRPRTNPYGFLMGWVSNFRICPTYPENTSATSTTRTESPIGGADIIHLKMYELHLGVTQNREPQHPMFIHGYISQVYHRSPNPSSLLWASLAPFHPPERIARYRPALKRVRRTGEHRASKSTNTDSFGSVLATRHI